MIRERLIKIVHEAFPRVKSEINYADNPETIEGWDSMGHLNLMMMVGGEFSTTFDFEDVMRVQSIGDIIQILNEKGIS